MIQTCKLCDEDKKLIKAHIIPKWAFNYIKHDNHFFQVSGIHRSTNELKSRKLQDGLKDDSILCKKCDGDVIGAYDTYAKNFFSKDFLSQIKVGNTSSGKGVPHIYVDNFDYVKLKLFLLSVLWRASISNASCYSVVNLGIYEDKVKKMLLDGKAYDENIFQIVLTTWQPPEKGEGYEKSLLLPRKRKFDAAKGYSIVMAGFEILFKVGQTSSSMHTEGINIHPEGFHVLVTNFESSTMGKLTMKIKEERRKY